MVTVDDIASRLRRSTLDVQVVGDVQVSVTGASHDSRSVRAGSLFACLRGDAFDGHEFAARAVEQGAAALLVDHLLDGIDVPQLVVGDTRLAVGPASAAAWGDPADRLQMVGITGTNGKTTTAQMVAALLEGAGVRTGIIGTLHGPRTTPEAPDLHATLAQFLVDGMEAVVMEVSSHALALHRIDGTRFDVVGFTNLGHDHLDLHGTHEEYFRAKSKLFARQFAPVAVLNVDDTHGRLLGDTIADRDGDVALDVALVSLSDVTDVVVGVSNHRYHRNGRVVEVPLGGEFNVANSLLAVAMAERLADTDGLDMDAALAGLARLESVPGRFELVSSDAATARGISVVVDYAHTPDGLERVLDAARAITEERVIVVFGCAGRRDREKRPVMGEIAARLADVAIATSDNPRGEDPDSIIDDVIRGVPAQYRARVTPQVDRRAAIRTALALATQGDVVVIAGKGHETTQDLGSEKIEFDDRRVAEEELKDLS